MNSHGKDLEQAYAVAKERYAAMGVDVEDALARLAKIPLSLHCWQGDDNTGFENLGVAMGGGLAITGNYPGKARTPEELRADYDLALSLSPGTHRVNLHSMYAETGGRKVERNQFQPEHYRAWIDWAKQKGLGIDFNPTCYGHPKAADGLTLAHPDAGIRRFWIEHCIACRKVGEAIGRALGKTCVTNVWIPDGYKDVTIDRKSPRERLAAALDEVFAAPIDPALNLDSVEPKLFGIGSETYVVGSFEFYLGYAITRKKLMCLDMGHFHPTETIADKISAIMLYVDRMLLHVSRGIRWDSDHVVILTDDLRATAEELVRGDYLGRVHIGLDYFDASIHRVAAWVIGMRAMTKALLAALVEPAGRLRQLEDNGDFTSRLALVEEVKTLPLGALWNYYCLTRNVPVGMAWMESVKDYERKVTSKRGS
jgi:L-rhamnose isomerase